MTLEQQLIAKGELKGRAEGELKGRAEGELKGRAEGELKGKAENVLAVLEVRGLAATAEQRARILDCRDVARLDRWHRAAITADSVEAMLAS